MSQNPKSIENLRKSEPYRFKPGESGNPEGRPCMGASLANWVNEFQYLNEPALKAIADDPQESAVRRGAAQAVLFMSQCGDLAAYEEFLAGKTLKELREAGVPTWLIKKAKVTHTKDGPQREIELRDLMGEYLDRLADRTAGKPKQSVEMTHDGSIRTTTEGADQANSLLTRIAARLGVDPGRATDGSNAG